MSITNPLIVDAMSVNEEDKKIVLFITDDTVWIDGEMPVEEHVQHLENKINTYIQFLKAEEHLKVYPQAVDYKPEIFVEFTYRIPFEVEDAFEALEESLNAKNIDFNYIVLQII